MSKTEDALHHVAAGRALLWLAYNRSAEDALRIAYGEGLGLHPDYLDAKARLWNDSPLRFLAGLDGPNIVRFWRGCMEVYGEDAYSSAQYALALAAQGEKHERVG